MENNDSYTPVAKTKAFKPPKPKDDRFRIWLTLVYPDEAYSDWPARLKETGTPIAYSPLHSSDVWRSTDPMISDERIGISPDIKEYNRRVVQILEAGKPKKPHYHVILHFDGRKSPEQVGEICISCLQPDPLKPCKCDSIGGSVRYLIHYDDPDKEQFGGINAITSLNGFDVAKYFKPTIAQEDQLFYSIRRIIMEENIKSYYKLMDFFCDHSPFGEFVEEYRYARSHCNLIKSFVDGRGRYESDTAVKEREQAKIHAINQISETLYRLHYGELQPDI